MSRNAEDCENSGSLPQLESEPEVEQIGEAPEEVPFEIPNKWKWVRLSSVQFLIRGITFPASAKHKEPKVGLIRCLTTGSVQQTHRPVSDVYVKSEYVKNNKQYLRRGDVVLSSANSRELVGKNIIWSCDAANVSFGGFLTVARSRTDVLASEFAYVVYQYLFVSGKFMEIATQTTNIANISNKVLAEIALPVPPLAEQRRIVARLNELLPLVDEFGEAQEASKVAQTEFPGKLKASLLQAAIEGKLVPQLESEPEVEQIGNAPEEVPFEIPKKWKWVQLKTIFAKRSTINPVDYGESKVELWSIPAFDKGKPEVVPARLIGSSKKVVVEGDVLLSKIVPHIKRAWVVSETNGYEKLASTEWIVFHSNDFFPNFLTMALTEPHFHSSLMSTISGMGSLKRANPQKVGELYIPCPSLAEQHRIVARLNKLLASINQLGD